MYKWRSLTAVWMLLACFLLVWLLSFSQLYQRVDAWLADAQQALLTREAHFSDVLVIDIDDASLERLKPYLGSWPYRRDAYALMLDYLSDMGVRAVVIDILLAEPRDKDDALAASLRRNHNATLVASTPNSDRLMTDDEKAQMRAFSWQTPPELPAQAWSAALLPVPALTAGLSSVVQLGMVPLEVDSDGVLRSLPLMHDVQGIRLPSVALATLTQNRARVLEFDAAAQRAVFGGASWPVDARGNVHLAFPKNANAMLTMPFRQVVEAALGLIELDDAEAFFKGKTVFIGGSAQLSDRVNTPRGVMSGTSILALAYQSLQDNLLLTPQRASWNALLIVLALLPLLVSMHFFRRKPLYTAMTMGIGLVVVEGGNLLLLYNQQQSVLLFPLLLIGVSWLMLERHARAQAQAEALSARQSLVESLRVSEARLEQTVEERTADLHAALAETRKASQSQSRLLAYISHDLRAPLATIINSVHLLTLDRTGDVRRYQDTIERSALHQLELIDDLVEYARGELKHIELVPTPTYLYDWLKHLTAQAELLAAQYGNRFLLKISPNLPPVVVFDPKRLRQVLLNLLGNAAKFTSHGEICFEVHSLPLNDNKIELSIAVSDTGAGIAQNEIERMFEPFERRQSTREGFGLGLSIARHLVRAMGGELSATSELDMGSRFSFCLTVDTANEADVMLPAQPFVFPEPFGANKTLLLVDDNPSSIEYLREVLSTADFDIVSVDNGTEALRVALAQKFDAILVDQSMPGLGGWDILRGLHETLLEATPPIILCSAMPPQRPDDFPDHIAFNDTLLKPIAANQLLATLQAVFSDQPSSPNETPCAAQPDAQAMSTLRHMVAEGRISDIKDWASALATRQPEWADFAQQVKTAAIHVDLAELDKLVNRVPVGLHALR